MRHLAAEREPVDADTIGVDPRMPGQELQRGERVGTPDARGGPVREPTTRTGSSLAR